MAATEIPTVRNIIPGELIEYPSADSFSVRHLRQQVFNLRLRMFKSLGNIRASIIHSKIQKIVVKKIFRNYDTSLTQKNQTKDSPFFMDVKL